MQENSSQTTQSDNNWELLSVVLFNAEKTARSCVLLVKQVEKRIVRRCGKTMPTRAQKKISATILKGKKQLCDKSLQMQQLTKEARNSIEEAKERGTLVIPESALEELRTKVRLLTKDLVAVTREAAQTLEALDTVRQRRRSLRAIARKAKQT